MTACTANWVSKPFPQQNFTTASPSSKYYLYEWTQSSTHMTLQTEAQASCNQKVIKPLLHLIHSTFTDCVVYYFKT